MLRARFIVVTQLIAEVPHRHCSKMKCEYFELNTCSAASPPTSEKNIGRVTSAESVWLGDAV
eukprot:12480-Heterococcus_DN1.PRE.1